MNVVKLFFFYSMISFLFVGCKFQSAKSIEEVSTYTNPVIAGDFPDPTVIKVGDTYYAATSSSEWALPYRLFQSKDLVNWEYIGPLFKEVPEWVMGSFWAPELYYHNETFYVYYTARRKSDKRSYIGVATSKDPKEGFTDRGLIIEWTSEAIDAYVIDIDNKPYITWKAYGLDERPIEILGAELSEDRLKVTGEAFSMITAESDTWEYGGFEGQCIVKHGDYLYMFYAGAGCCGRNCNYATGVARSKTIDGQWERYEGNPILFGGETWKCSGHGTLVETPDHRFFYLYHAYNAETNVHIGRQVMLDEIVWDEQTGWPKFRYGDTPSLQAETPFANTIQHAIPDFKDDFSSSTLKKEWIWDVSKDKPQTKLTNKSVLVNADETPTGAFLGLQLKTGNYTFEVNVENQQAVYSGIALYGSHKEAIGISVKGSIIELWSVEEGKRAVITQAETDQQEITLYLSTRHGNECQFGWKDKEGEHPIGQLQNIDRLPQWDRPANPGIQAYGNGNAVFKNVSLKWE
ncbi:glycoside hydrolase family 43 protein [Massilibacteroides sp.]|uniref:glycoside hydrolase family 43 protein n=1 Tax=Massilibacteroides sp. TaxID=2034766 RepID=UPI00262830F5|nr:glycoside hydrolase family 43 protein [Massilibacteroides sp.]MDD4514090.1 glycoside hydrolase family 43 protein [Massilibacteroides sp.]